MTKQTKQTISLQYALLSRTGNQRFPKDYEIQNALKEKDIYNIRSKNRIYLLERLENYQNNEPVNIEVNPDITIEHIFPRNPDPEWKQKLSEEEYNYIKEHYLNTIGNITLSGNNRILGNKYFTEKQEMNVNGKEQGYKFSRLWLNRDLKDATKWGKEEIEKRINIMTERFLKVWPFPEVNIKMIPDTEEVNIFDIQDPTGRTIEYFIFLEKKYEPQNTADFYVTIMKKLYELHPNVFMSKEWKKKLKISDNSHEYGNLSYAELGDNYFIFINTSSMDKFQKIKQIIKELGYEDDLSIKYAN